MALLSPACFPCLMVMLSELIIICKKKHIIAIIFNVLLPDRRFRIAENSADCGWSVLKPYKDIWDLNQGKMGFVDWSCCKIIWKFYKIYDKIAEASFSMSGTTTKWSLPPQSIVIFHNPDSKTALRLFLFGYLFF